MAQEHDGVVMIDGISGRRPWQARSVRAMVWLGSGILVVVTAGLAIVEVRSTRRFDAPYPQIAASTDPSVVAAGEYLVYGPGACAYCHVPRSEWGRLDRGERLPLTGDHLFPLPFGAIYSANLTPDRATGIGRRTDGELARILRHGVRADGRAAVPLMEYRLTDEDLIAVVSYLRSRPAVSYAVNDHKFTLLGKALMAFAITPESTGAAAPQQTARGASVARGAYLANHVSSCVACHTNRGEDGALVGAPFGGGQRMDVAADATRVYVTPNLTPDPDSSPIGQWDEATFMARFRTGEQIRGTPMPWGAYARMTDEDLSAVFKYLRSLPPTRHQTGAVVQAK